MDTALKQRLLGAAVLVVLAVVFVPMVLDGARDPVGETVDLTIPPAPERDFETRVVPLAPPDPAPSPVASAPGSAAPVDDRVVAVDTEAPTRVDALAGTPGAPVTAAAPAVPPAAASAPVPAAGGAASASEPTTPVPAAAAERGRFVVHLGSYARAENAAALVAELGRAGFPARSERIVLDGGAGQRVRIGPYATRAEAERARLDVRRLRPDVPAALAEIDDTPAADAPPAVAGRPTGWAVQVGAFQSEADARALVERLRAQGYAAFLDPVRAASGTLHRVRVGPDADRAGAERLRSALRERFQLDGLIVTHP